MIFRRRLSAEQLQQSYDQGIADRQDLEDVLGNIWLYIDWKFITKQLTTAQKERFADAVEAWSARLNEETSSEEASRWWQEEASTVSRWWRES